MKILLIALGFLVTFGAAANATPKQVMSPTQGVPAGSIVIHAHERALYFIVGDGSAIRYPVAVPKSGKEWSGATRINGKYYQPAWTPPSDVRHDHPELPDVIAGGDPTNPMGAAAMTLEKSEIAIHGTAVKMRKSIGTAASYGCIRMYNEDVLDLYGRVSVGALVIMQR
jgi:lipoprotein-anchoring transpeptidase ErfK/SrfK